MTLLSVLLALPGCSKPEPVRIGFLGGLTGRVADLGIAGRDGAILAVEHFNQQGGLHGRPIELRIQDDAQNQLTARTAFAKLIADDVQVIVGPMTSEMAVAVTDLLEGNAMVMVSPTVTTDALSGLDDRFIRVIGPTSYTAGKHARYHAQQMNWRKVAVAYDLSNRAFSESWLNDYRAALLEEGGEIHTAIGFTSGEQAMLRSVAGQLVAGDADGVMIIASALDAALLCQYLRAARPEIAIAAAEWAATEHLIRLGGQAVEGVLTAQFIDPDNRNPAYTAFRQEYAKRFNRAPGFVGVLGYEAAAVAMEGLKRRKEDGDLKSALIAAGRFDGLQGEVVIDRFGDGRRAIYLSRIENGRFRVISRL